MRWRVESIVLPVATHPGKSGTEAPQSLSGSLLMRTRYRSLFTICLLYLLPDLVDGLEDGHPAPGLQHPVELANTRLLIGEVDQDRTRHYDVDALACQWNVQRVTAHASQGSDIRRRFCLVPALRQRVGGPISKTKVVTPAPRVAGASKAKSRPIILISSAPSRGTRTSTSTANSAHATVIIAFPQRFI